MLVRLLYVSRATQDSATPNPRTGEGVQPTRSSGTAESEMQSILESAKNHNMANGITGILCFGGGIYLQAIEGGRRQVNELYAQLVQDKRHKDVQLLHYEEITERRFGGWSMGQVNLSKLNASVVLKYSEEPELNPYSVSGAVSLALLEELMATAAIIGRA